MKSIIFLLLTSCCFFPFSSATFTSNNPIILPTTTHDNNIVLPAIRDADGDPLKTGEKYIIQTPLLGSGAVYLGCIGRPICPNAVLQHISVPGQLGDGTPVKFFFNSKPSDEGDVVREGYAVNIMFSVHTSERCANETVWKVDDKAFVVTGGTLGDKRDIFKIRKYEGRTISEYAYKLMYCPPQLMCEDVSSIRDNGYPHLTTIASGDLPFIFIKERMPN